MDAHGKPSTKDYRNHIIKSGLGVLALDPGLYSSRSLWLGAATTANQVGFFRLFESYLRPCLTHAGHVVIESHLSETSRSSRARTQTARLIDRDAKDCPISPPLISSA